MVTEGVKHSMNPFDEIALEEVGWGGGRREEREDGLGRREEGRERRWVGEEGGGKREKMGWGGGRREEREDGLGRMEECCAIRTQNIDVHTQVSVVGCG